MQNLEAYKNIKVPFWVYQNAKEVELALMRKGIQVVPHEVLQPEHCPICRSAFETVESEKNTYLKCTHCGYTQQQFAPSRNEGIMMGTAIGMGLIYLLSALFPQKN